MQYFGDVLDARVLSSVRVLALRAGIFEQDKILLFVFSTLQFLFGSYQNYHILVSIRKSAKRGHCTRAEQEYCIMTD